MIDMCSDPSLSCILIRPVSFGLCGYIPALRMADANLLYERQSLRAVSYPFEIDEAPTEFLHELGGCLFIYTSPKGLSRCPIYIKSDLQSIYLSQSIYI